MLVTTEMGRHGVAKLFAGWADTMVQSYLGGCMGHALVDNEESPAAGAIVVGDFAMAAGRADPALLDIPPHCHPNDALLIVPGSDDWAQCIQARFGADCQSFQRYAIRRQAQFDLPRLRGFANSLPQGYHMTMLDRGLYAQVMATPWAQDFCSLFADCDDYLARGLGVAVFHGRELVAGASSYSVFPGGIEIEIDTREDHRQRGLVTACGARLMLEALERGLYPNWDAADLRSVALAEKLGYQLDHPYLTYRVSLPRAGC